MDPTQDTRALHDLVSREASSPPSDRMKKEVERLIARNATLNFPSVKEGYPHYPLAVAIRERQPEWVQYLLEMGASTMLDESQLRPEDVDDDPPSFQPLGISLDILCMEVSLCRQEWMDDPDNLDMQILGMLLDHRADVLESDPWRKNAFEPACEMPLLRWADHLVALKEELDGDRLDPGQARIAIAVMDALLARAPEWFQGQVKDAVRNATLNSSMDQDARRFCEKIMGCPEVFRAWWSEVEASRMDRLLPSSGKASSPSFGSFRL